MSSFSVYVCVFHRKAVVFSKWVIYEIKDVVGQIFDINEWLIQCNADSHCEHIIGGINIYLCSVY